MGEGRGVEHAVVGADRVEVGEVAEGRGQQVAVGEGGALGATRRPSRAEEPRRVFGAPLDEVDGR